MSALYVPSFPMWEYLRSFTWFIGIVMILGVIVLIAYPSQKIKVALLWIAVGLFQVVFSGFYAYPYGVFDYFPTEVAYGLFTLTCGVVLATFSIMKTQSPRRILGIGFLILGCLELVAFLDFLFKFPNFGEWNILINATPYIAFLVAAVATLSCGILAFLKSKK